MSQVDVILFIGWGPTKKRKIPTTFDGDTPFELGHVQNTIRVDKMIVGTHRAMFIFADAKSIYA